MDHRLIPWYHEGAISKEVLQQCMDYAHARQDPETGFWGAAFSRPSSCCIPTWLKWDMAPAIPQGAAFGWGIYSYEINICVDILGIADRVPWTATWRQRDEYDTRAFIEVGKEIQKS